MEAIVGLTMGLIPNWLSIPQLPLRFKTPEVANSMSYWLDFEELIGYKGVIKQVEEIIERIIASLIIKTVKTYSCCWPQANRIYLVVNFLYSRGYHLSTLYQSLLCCHPYLSPFLGSLYWIKANYFLYFVNYFAILKLVVVIIKLVVEPQVVS